MDEKKMEQIFQIVNECLKTTAIEKETVLAENDEVLPRETIMDKLERTAKGGIVQSVRNFTLVLTHDEKLSGLLRLNEMTERIDVTKDKAFWERDGLALTDTDKAYLQQYLESRYGLVKEKARDAAIRIVANENRYHPVKEYLNGLEWDNVPRIRNMLHHFLGADTSDKTYESMKIFLLGAIRRVFEKGCKFEYMLCLVGSQGIGKSTFFRFLAIKDEWYTDDLKRLEDENVYRKLQGHWIIEMGEMLGAMKASSVEAIKAFLSRQADIYKVPYETEPRDRPRQCVFGGTTNSMEFLPFDRSGNRRFIPVLTNPDEMEVHILADEISSRQYIDQVWAEAMELYRSGNYSMKFTLETEKQLEADLSTFMPEDTQVGIIQAFLDNCSYDYVCTILLYCEACHHPDMEPKSWERREIRDIMDRKIQGWEKTGQHRYREYGKQRSWRRVPVKPVEKPATEGFEPVPEQMSIPFDEETISDNNCLAEDNQKKDSSDVNKGCMGTE